MENRSVNAYGSEWVENMTVKEKHKGAFLGFWNTVWYPDVCVPT